MEFNKVVRRGGKGRIKAEIANETIADTKRRVALIANDWLKPTREFKTSALLMRAGPRPGIPMAPGTARRELGRRLGRQREYQTEINREADQAGARAWKAAMKETQDAT